MSDRMNNVVIKAIVFDLFGVTRSGGQINYDLLDYVGELKKGYKTALLSNVIDLDKYFDLKIGIKYFDVIAASDRIGFAKPRAEAYFYVLDKLNVLPNESVMVDDLEWSVQGAVDAGMHGILYKNLDQLKQDLEKLLNA